MPSTQSRLLYFAMKNRHLMKFQLKAPVWDENTSIPAFRAQCEEGASRSRMPEGVEAVPVEIPGLPTGLSAEWLTPANALPDRAIFYTHGGGYISGSCSDHRALVAKIARGTGIRTLLYEYRLAPENPFPAAMEDTICAYRWLLSQVSTAQNIAIAGESAGGGLCLAALLAIRDLGLPLPAAAAAMSPWTDLTLTGESYRTRLKQCVSPQGMSEVCSKAYAGGNNLENPWISPLFGDLHGLPPTLIHVGDYETMRDDATRFAKKAREASVDVKLRVGEGMIHCYPLLAPLFPEATEALDEICTFIKGHTGSEKHDCATEAAPVR